MTNTNADSSTYLPRIADQLLLRKLKSSGAVLIEGPKWCGKTWTASHISASKLNLQDPDTIETYKGIAELQPSRLLDGETPRLLDEWQVIPKLWDAVRNTVDLRGEVGQFILTGSATPNEENLLHSGVGRIARMKMYPMSLYESRESTGEVSLQELFDGKTENISGESKLNYDDISYSIVRGGWPLAVTQKDKTAAIDMAKNYIEEVIASDISRLDNVKRNPERVRVLLQSLARNITTPVSNETIMKDVRETFIEGITDKTLSDYLNALQKIFVVRDIPAWRPNLRSKTAIRAAAKRQFIDPSLATAILNLSPNRLIDDPNFFGLLFESLCDRDIRIYIEALGGDIYHYREDGGNEVDIIPVLSDGRWAEIEVKLSEEQVDKAAENLIALKNKIEAEINDGKKWNPPSFLAVLTGAKYAYKRKDGVYVVPLGCLKP